MFNCLRAWLTPWRPGGQSHTFYKESWGGALGPAAGLPARVMCIWTSRTLWSQLKVSVKLLTKCLHRLACDQLNFFQHFQYYFSTFLLLEEKES